MVNRERCLVAFLSVAQQRESKDSEKTSYGLDGRVGAF